MDVGRGIVPGDGTALNWAAAEGHLGVVKLLVSRGAKLNIKAEKPAFFGTGDADDDGFRKRQAWTSCVSCLILGWIRTRQRALLGGMLSSVHARRVSSKSVKYFVQIKGFDTGRKTCERMAPLHMATKGEQLDVMKFLVDSGAVLNGKDKNGDTPLHFVALNGSARTAVWLRQHGADTRARNESARRLLTGRS